jgi:hypothetical protein
MHYEIWRHPNTGERVLTFRVDVTPDALELARREGLCAGEFWEERGRLAWEGGPNVGVIVAPLPDPIFWYNVGGIVLWTNDLLATPLLRLAAEQARGYRAESGRVRGTVMPSSVSTVLQAFAPRRIRAQATRSQCNHFQTVVEKAREAHFKTMRAAMGIATARGGLF